MGRSVSKLDDAYVALRKLIASRFASQKTRESALRALKNIEQQALAELILQQKNAEEDDPPRAA
jgi:hypothetical protein